MNKLKYVAAAVCCTLAVGSLAACGSSSSGGKQTVEFMTMQSTGTPQLKALESITKKFEAKNPDIHIKLNPGTNTNENDIKVRLAGHNPPDIWNTHGWSRDRYANFLEPLQDRPWAKRMKPIGNDVYKTKDGKFYALPADIQVSGIMYNETVLSKAGIDPKSINSWDAFKQACDKLKSEGVTPIISSPKDPGPDGDLADYVLPGLYKSDELASLKSGKFDTKIYQGYTSMISQWSKAGYFNEDYTSATVDDVARLMAQDKAGFYFRSNGNAQLITSYNPNVKLGMMPLPSNVGEPYFSTGEDTLTFGVSKTSKVKDAALKYIDFMAEPENLQELVDVSMNDSALTGVKSALGQFQTTYDYWVKDKKTKTVPFFDRAYLPNGMYNTLYKSTDGLITGQLTPESAADQVKSSFDSLYGQKSS
ncbi:putative ABC transporter substrate-binding protein [Bifidobacterium actinocoloniiforme DSM 22766]|uniref:Putative ABC transporter substrate-binding protein n=1 Tax=Bifidobacterium actinocoloniiforme DSM 22766 TaxID=1437605 RepID=A0A086YWC5_9BIFI|nr:ABC transporter substrate-binding protein [Bifidobacterium actinocoloniiforme]AKV55780.1 ABC transporter substrate-binding protein [Bifidobacterium actinocoloniiforme DSM 22766]KFI38575.1 putative ABC transporter substrate-binding protein [Bifidobacterium actinocoloniiforme DSM 22766]